ncbi:MAG: general secretion pathway protein GspC [Deltaproteobacteria bacterium]|nr:general secretion pathway protein GspC [Deltaproteobacteria bacterium]
MELLFRKYFWAVNLLFLALAALLVARALNVFTESALAGAPDVNPPVSTAPRPAYAMATRLDPEAMSRVTGIPLPKPEVALKEPALGDAKKDDLTSVPLHTTLHVRLLGTTVSTNKYWSFAVIEDTQAHTNDTYMVDDRIQGAKVLDILDDCTEFSKDDQPNGCVIVLNNGHREYIDDKEGNGPVAAIVAKPTEVANTEPPPSTVNGNGIRSVGENKYQVQKSELDKTLSNLNDVAMQARIVPAFKDGVATGFKLFSIRPDSIYSKIGVQNGDVIRRINGFEINSPDKALEAYAKLKDSSHIEIEIDRNGSTVNKQYDVVQ